MMTDNNLRIAAVRLVCHDVEAAVRFYEAAFKCRRSAANGADAAVMFGGQRLEFVRVEAGGSTTVAASNSTAFQHCAIVVSDMAAAMACLEKIDGWSAISTDGPEKLPKTSGGVKAFKFRDPEGHPLEFLEFPVGNEPNHWRRISAISGAETPPFLGIDHSAITVANTRTAIVFYEQLGFTVTSQQINRGPEQARMDGVGDPVVEVTSLTSPGGAPPHLELLRYRKPPVFAQPVADGDAMATRLVLVGDAPDVAAERRDPDGHRLIGGNTALIS